MASRRKFRRIATPLFLVTFFFLIFNQLALSDLKLPEPKGFVNDFAGMLSSQTESDLESRLKAYEKETTNEIAVVTVENLQGTTVEDYAVRLFEKWKIGKKGKDNGILLLIAKSERKMRIEVGYGLESTLTDSEAYGIIVNSLRPKFRANDYDGGVTGGVNQIIKGLSGAELPEVSPDQEDSPASGFDWTLIGVVILLFIAFSGFWIVAILARSSSWWAGGVLGAIVGLVAMLILGFLTGLVLMFVFTPLGLGFDYLVSNHFKSRKKKGEKPSWWAGSWWGPGTSGGGFSGSSGGFGGFGGGGSGGGGASGDW